MRDLRDTNIGNSDNKVHLGPRIRFKSCMNIRGGKIYANKSGISGRKIRLKS